MIRPIAVWMRGKAWTVQITGEIHDADSCANTRSRAASEVRAAGLAWRVVGGHGRVGAAKTCGWIGQELPDGATLQRGGIDGIVGPSSPGRWCAPEATVEEKTQLGPGPPRAEWLKTASFAGGCAMCGDAPGTRSWRLDEQVSADHEDVTFSQHPVRPATSRTRQRRRRLKKLHRPG